MNPAPALSLRIPARGLIRALASSKTILGLICVLGSAIPSTRADVVTEWNQTMLQAAVATNSSPFALNRIGAIVQTAVFDAVNATDRRYTSLTVTATAPTGFSPRAAAVQAAYVTLVNLIPAQKTIFDSKRTAALAALAADTVNETAAAIALGVQWGQSVGDAVLANRANDGFNSAPPNFLGGTAPGQWRTTPPPFAAGMFMQVATMTPWLMQSPSQFRPKGPPALDSALYAAELNETKTMGSTVSASRTADQTLASQFWATVLPGYFWNTVANVLVAEHAYGLVDNARLLALVNIALADSAIACFDAKYFFTFWRPVTAIQNAAADGNAATAEDPSWSSLIVAPAFPEYPSAHSTLSAAAAGVLADAFGDRASFSVASYSLPGVTRSYTSFSAALDEAALARIYGGIHFRTACNDGRTTGAAVARYAVDHAALTRQRIAHLAVRGSVTPNDVLIAGFVLQGTAAKSILVRATGASLANFGITGALARPRLQLFNGSSLMQENTGWSTAANSAAIAQTTAAVGAFGFSATSSDSAILATLAPGTYTAVARSADGAGGTSLVQIYDTSGTNAQLLATSARGFVGRDDQVLIAGLEITGNDTQKILIRAVGPTLSSFGLSSALADPQLQIYRGSTPLAQNDNWSNDPEVRAAAVQMGSFALPADSKDAALVIALPAGAYTIVVSGVGGATGTALIEAYKLP